MILKNQNFVENDHIIDFKIKDPITSKVGNFYELDPFPNYEINDNKQSIQEIGNKNFFLKNLKVS